MNDADLIALRRQKDQFFKTSPHSPLTPEQQDAFQGIRFFAPNPALDLVVDVERLPGDAVTVQTTSGEVRQYQRYGRFTFTVDGENAALTVYETPHGFFLPFTDAAEDIYGGGRYLEPELLNESPDRARFEVNFNLAYNPYCAYGPGWSCPLVPLENRLKVAIRAGEKQPEER
ncbi:MAG: DUF1684 domain-containing protein [Anaerolineae bacterium]|nr:DUF1684 domain-containing protein [Anaerolineae bacterium]